MQYANKWHAYPTFPDFMGGNKYKSLLLSPEKIL